MAERKRSPQPPDPATVLRDHLAATGVEATDLEPGDGGAALAWRHRGQTHDWYAQAWWLPTAEQLLVYSVSPLEVTGDRWAELAEFVRLANTGLVSATLELDDPGGDLRCRTGAWLAPESVTADVVRRIVHANVGTFDVYLPGIEGVLAGDTAIAALAYVTLAARRMSRRRTPGWNTGVVPDSPRDLPRKAAARTARLAGLPLSYAGRSALGLGRRLGGAPADAVLTEIQQRTAEQVFRTLGELKGGAMKFGQALSVFEAALPEEMAAPYRDQLTKLQDSAPPMPTQTVREILARELGADWKERLVWLDGGPTASASIGQVHRGRWHDGREVAVKVQYPGAGDALRADLRQLSRLARTIGPLFPGIEVKPLVEEMQARFEEELDYSLEAEAQRAFAEAFDGDPEIVVPRVVDVGPSVLVTEWMDSEASLASIIRDGTQAERDHYAELLVRFVFTGPGRTGMLHADPHPGNFRVIPDDDGVARQARRPRLRRRRPAARRAPSRRPWAG